MRRRRSTQDLDGMTRPISPTGMQLGSPKSPSTLATFMNQQHGCRLPKLGKSTPDLLAGSPKDRRGPGAQAPRRVPLATPPPEDLWRQRVHSSELGSLSPTGCTRTTASTASGSMTRASSTNTLSNVGSWSVDPPPHANALWNQVDVNRNVSFGRQPSLGVRSASTSSLLQRRQCPTALHVMTDLPAPENTSRVPSSRQRKEIRRLKEGEKIFDLYCWQEVLQETGDGGKVVVCRPRGSMQQFVLKIRAKESLTRVFMEETFRSAQLKLLNLPPHAGVLALTEVLEDDNFFYIVMEKAEGGSFFTALLREFTDGVMTAEALRRVMREILEAVGHVHGQGMLHRDIKPDNLVMQVHEEPTSPTGKVSKVALIDFDHADPNFNPQTPSWENAWCGTVSFSAPETFRGFYSQASDLYSVGVILYMLMTGKLPYRDDVYAEELRPCSRAPWRHSNWKGTVFARMKEAVVDWDCDPWPSQPDCKDFCMKLMAFDPDERMGTAAEALLHNWMIGETDAEGS